MFCNKAIYCKRQQPLGNPAKESCFEEMFTLGHSSSKPHKATLLCTNNPAELIGSEKKSKLYTSNKIHDSFPVEQINFLNTTQVHKIGMSPTHLFEIITYQYFHISTRRLERIPFDIGISPRGYNSTPPKGIPLISLLKPMVHICALPDQRNRQNSFNSFSNSPEFEMLVGLTTSITNLSSLFDAEFQWQYLT